MTRPAWTACLAAGSGLIAWLYFSTGRVLEAFAILVLGLAWGLGVIFRRKWLTGLCVFGMYGFCAAGFFIDLRSDILLPASIALLLAWDLGDFSDRLRRAAPGDDAAGLERRHLLRLALLALLAGGLIFIGLARPAHLAFEWLALLVILGVAGMIALIGWLLRPRE